VLQDAASICPSEGSPQTPYPEPLYPTIAHLNADNSNELQLSLPPESLSHSAELRTSADMSRQRLEKDLSINMATTTLAYVNAASTVTPDAFQKPPPAVPRNPLPAAAPVYIKSTSFERHGVRAMPLAVSTEQNTQHNKEQQQQPEPPKHGQQVVKAPAQEVPDTFDMSHTGVSLLPVPAVDASISAKIDFMHQQLDSLGAEAEALPGLVLLGSGVEERLQGGAVPSFACSSNCVMYADVHLLMHHRSKNGDKEHFGVVICSLVEGTGRPDPCFACGHTRLEVSNHSLLRRSLSPSCRCSLQV
jgi:hypothetical protein